MTKYSKLLIAWTKLGLGQTKDLTNLVRSFVFYGKYCEYHGFLTFFNDTFFIQLVFGCVFLR